MKNNVYPAGSLFEPQQTGNGAAGDADWPAVGFVDFAHGDYKLAPSSKYKARGTDGKDLGVDIDGLGAALRRAQPTRASIARNSTSVQNAR
jgi:hypothetical protein